MEDDKKMYELSDDELESAAGGESFKIAKLVNGIFVIDGELAK